MPTYWILVKSIPDKHLLYSGHNMTKEEMLAQVALHIDDPECTIMTGTDLMYGIYNVIKKEFQFGICEPTPQKAREALFRKIGKDAYKWRFEAKRFDGSI